MAGAQRAASSVTVLLVTALVMFGSVLGGQPAHGATSPPVVAATATTTEARLVTVAPTRLADTRSGLGGRRGAVSARGTLTVHVAGRAGVPASGATAVVVNITAVGPASTGFVTAYPAGGPRPTTSNLNYAAGQTIANSAVVALDSTGSLTLYTSATAHLLVDISAWQPVGSTYAAMPPTRVLDTRPEWGTWPPRDGIVEVPIAGLRGVPANAQAVTVNLTAAGALAPGNFTAYPNGEDPPPTSNLNFATGATVAAGATVRVGVDGKIRIKVAGQAHVVVDVSGYYRASSEFTPVAPTRLLDTRSTARVPAGGTARVDLSGLAGLSGSRLVTPVLTVTATAPTGPGYLTVYGGGTRPTVSSLNYVRGQTIANQVFVQPGAGPSVTVYTPVSTHLIVDVVGYVAAAPPLGRAADVSAFGSHACALTTDGAVFCWGNNTLGQLGDASTTIRYRATPVPGLGAGVKQVEAGWSTTCAVLESNELRCWGDNSRLQLGLPGTENRLTPTTVLAATPLKRTVALHSGHGCAVTGDSLSCWGGSFGTPSVVSGLDHGVTEVGVGSDFTCALSTAGEVLCFGGINAYGQLSNGPAATDGRPGRIVQLRSSAVGLVVGGYTVCAELTDGSTWCWGSGYGDIRGDGDRDGTAEPVQRRSNDVPRTLRISQSLACGVHAVEATPACFGGTLEGSPHSVAGVAPAEGFACVLLRDGRVTCQGANNWGQLGDGTTTARFAPATVIGFG